MLVFANFTRFDKYFHIDPVAAEIYSIHFGQKRCAASVTKDKIPPQKAHRLLASKKNKKKPNSAAHQLLKWSSYVMCLKMQSFI